MKPRLVAISGPIRESHFVLPDEEASVGRDPSNQLCINDPSVSRRHCVIGRADKEFQIRDLGSRNGTQVNGISVKQQTLRHGDQLGIGDTVFLFLVEEGPDKVITSSVEFDDRQLTHATAQIHPQDVLYLQPEKILNELPAGHLTSGTQPECSAENQPDCALY